MKEAKEKDEKPRKVGFHAFLAEKLMLIPFKLQRHEDPLSKIIQFHIMKDITDSQPTIVRREHRISQLLLSVSDFCAEVLNNDSRLEEIIWNFSRFPPEMRLTLLQNPHFYNHLPTSSNANWGEFNTNATQENWHTYHTKPICVLTNTPGRVFLELCRNPRAFDNVWNANESLIFKSERPAFRFFLLL